MVRGMYSAVSGMLNNQERMDVIGNNIANANTIAFKDSRMTFAQSFAQESKSATATTPVGISVGLGAQISSTDINFTQGAFQLTNIPSDLAIGGDGFFTVTTQEDGSGTRYFTRAGNFVINQDGYLQTTDGNYLQGYSSNGSFSTAYTFADPTAVTDTSAPPQPIPSATTLSAIIIPTQFTYTTPAAVEKVVNYDIASDGAINVTGENGTTMIVGYVPVVHFSNNKGLSYQFNNYYSVSSASGNPIYNQAGTGSSGTISNHTLELSNVDLAGQFADMIITQRGFDANAKTITATDEMMQTVINIKR